MHKFVLKLAAICVYTTTIYYNVRRLVYTDLLGYLFCFQKFQVRMVHCTWVSTVHAHAYVGLKWDLGELSLIAEDFRSKYRINVQTKF
jgi:hypothetical protein